MADVKIYNMEKNKKLLYFYAYWDGCMEYKKRFIELCNAYNLHYELIDCETERGVELSCQFHVKNCPTILFMRKGKVVERSKGNYAEEFIEKIVKKY